MVGNPYNLKKLKNAGLENDTGLVLDNAIQFAVNAHSGMFRKGTKIPYIVHPLESAAIVASMTDDEIKM